MQERNGARAAGKRLANDVAEIRHELEKTNERMDAVADVPRQVQAMKHSIDRLAEAVASSLAGEGAVAYLRALDDCRHSDDGSSPGW